MDTKTFFSRLAVVTAFAGILLAAIHSLAVPAQPHAQFAIVTLVLFVLICIGLYFAGASAAGSKNKYAFTNLVSVSVFGKMVFSVGYLFAYQKIASPQNQWFVGIFLLCYVIFTVFEVWFMTRLAKS